MTEKSGDFTRPALAPGLLAAIALLGGLALIDSEWFVIIRYAVSILALIIVVFAVQGKKLGWLVVLIPIAVIWNPVWPLGLSGPGWLFLQMAGAVCLIAAGIKITVGAAGPAR